MHSIPMQLQLYVPMLLSGLALSIGTLIVLSLIDSGSVQSLQRAVLAHQLHKLRLSRMLRKRGIDEGRYVRLIPVAELRTAVANCRSCPEQGKCDAVLAAPGWCARSLPECPNTRALDRFVDSAHRR